MSSKSNQHYTSVFPNYCDRAGRNSYAAALIQEIETKFGLELRKGLNLGSDGAQLEKVSVLQGSKVDWLELDMQNDPPFFIDLDKIERLDFEKEKFDVCIALDVLEHIEQFHLIVDEMHRVSKTLVVLSLPNPITEVFNVLLNRAVNSTDANDAGFYSKYYGFPKNKTLDRHRWWFAIDDVIRYFDWFAKTKNCSVVYLTKPAAGIKGVLIKLLLSKRIYRNFVWPYIWVVLIKRPPIRGLS